MSNRKIMIISIALILLFAVSAYSAQNIPHGYCIFMQDMDNVDFKDLSNRGITDLFLNYHALDSHDKNKVETWIQNAKAEGISVHIWAQVFNDDTKWYDPTNQSFVDGKINELKEYASLKDIKGIHLNYVRYEGANDSQKSEYTQAVSDFVVKATDELKKEKPDLIISSDVMPDYDNLKENYCTDYSVISKNFDFVIPLTYIGDYSKNDTLMQESIKCLKKNSQGAKVWANVQTFNGTDNSTLPLKDLNSKIESVSKANPDGILLYQYGLSEKIDFNK